MLRSATPESVPMFVVMQCIGAAIAIVAARFWYPHMHATEMVIAHDE